MRLKCLSQNHTDGVITIEIAVCSILLIILFALFFTITGYCRSYLEVKEYTDTKTQNTAVLAYAAGFDVPGFINTSDFDCINKGQIKNLLIFHESWGNEVKLNSSYTYVSLFGNYRVKMSSCFTKWAGNSPKSKSIVWDLSPMERGKVIENIFGGGLPEFFPVIDAFDEISGNAALIMSIDTSLPYYESGTQIKNIVFENIKELAAFKYGKYEEYIITDKDIESRELIVVIPENQLNDKQSDSFIDCIGFANENGIILTIKKYQFAKMILPDEIPETLDCD